MKSYSEAGLNPEISSVQDAVSTAASERFSTSSPDMKPAVLIITLKYSRLFKMQFIGQLRQTDSKIRVCR